MAPEEEAEGDADSNRFAEVRDSRGRFGDRAGKPASLLGRACFFQAWNWASLSDINRRLCENGKASYGASSETHDTVQKSWEDIQGRETSFEEALDFLRSCHKSAPFLNFNGNTFSAVGQVIAQAILSDISPTRKRIVVSTIVHYIAGVAPKSQMEDILFELEDSRPLQIGDRVQTLKGSLIGEVIRFDGDGRVVWKVGGTGSEFVTALHGLKRI